MFRLTQRLSNTSSVGLAYTLSKGMGMQGWDPYTADPNLTFNAGGRMVQGGKEALRERYWGPTAVDRRHNLTVNYSYAIPTFFEDNRVLKAMLENWQRSNVVSRLGTAADCG